MSNIEIDNKYLYEVADSAQEMSKKIHEYIEIIIDKNEHAFKRYIAFQKLTAFQRSIELAQQMVDNLLIAGHDLNDEYFHSEEYEKCRWGKTRLTENYFFKDDDDEDEEETDQDSTHALPEEVKKHIQEVVNKMIG